jgi:hypothetical protein
MTLENVETVRKIYADFNSVDPHAFDNFDPGIEFRQTAGLIGTAATYRGS